MATILMKQGKTRAAITEFESILGVASDKQSIHQKLFELYEKLDRHDLASVHLEKANALANKLASKAK
jgi:Tfp pilus assembly protein PilF